MNAKWVMVAMFIGLGLFLSACESTPIPTTDSAATTTIVSPQAAPVQAS